MTSLSKIEVDWNDVFAGNLPEPSPRRMFHNAVAAAADAARAAMPDSDGRINKAQQLVLMGDVEKLEGNRFAVGSQSEAGVRYVVDNACDCPDAGRAPDGVCTHVIATWLWRKARAAVEAEMHELGSNGSAQSATSQLPEAPASANFFAQMGGHRIQITIRNQDEGWLLSRLEALLSRFPVAAEPSSPSPTAPPAAPPEGWCAVHQVQMTQPSNAGGNWWSHKTDDGWCKGRAS